jgi:hypothetical protein
MNKVKNGLNATIKDLTDSINTSSFYLNISNTSTTSQKKKKKIDNNE